MAIQPGSPFSPDDESTYRLVVRRASPGRKSFMWEIVHGTATKQSSELFKTMEEAYTAGSVALNQLRKPGRAH